MADRIITVTNPSVVTNDTLASYNNYSNIDGLLGSMTIAEAAAGKTVTLSDGATHQVTSKPVGTTNGEFAAVVSNAVAVDLSAQTKYYLTMQTSDEITGIITGVGLPSSLGVGDYYEIKCSFTATNDYEALFSAAGGAANGNFRTQLGTDVRYLTSTNTGVTALAARTADVFYTFRVEYVDGTNVKIYQDAIEVTQNLKAMWLAEVFFAGTKETTGTDSNRLSGKVEYIDINGDKIEFSDTTTTHASVSGDITLTLTSETAVDISALFESIP